MIKSYRAHECLELVPDVVELDFTEVESRVARQFAKPPLDIHVMKAMEMYDCEAHEVTSEMRRLAKCRNYHTIYSEPFALTKVDDHDNKGLAVKILKHRANSCGTITGRYSSRFGNIIEIDKEE